MKTFKKVTFIVLLFVFLAVLITQGQSLKPSMNSITGISLQDFPGNAGSRYFNYFPFFTNQLSFMLEQQKENPVRLKFGFNAIVNRYIYETVLFEHTIAFRSDYYLSLPVLFEKKYEIKKTKPNSQVKKYRSIYCGLSVDWYIAQFDNLFYYEFNGYMPDDNGDFVYVELLLRGKDAKQYNTFRFINNQIPLAMSFHFGFSKYYVLENNAELETGFNFQFMDVVSLYNENIFFPGNGLKLNFNFLLAYHFGKKEKS